MWASMVGRQGGRTLATAIALLACSGCAFRPSVRAYPEVKAKYEAEFAKRELEPIEGFWRATNAYAEGELVVYRTPPAPNTGYAYAARGYREHRRVALPYAYAGTRVVARWNPTPSETEYRGEVLVVQGKRVYWVPASLRLIDAVTCEVIVHSPEPLLGGSIQRMQCIGPAPLLEQRISAISAARSASRAASPEAGPHVRSGSGFAVAADLIVTNWHVVENAQTVVCFIDGDSRPATVTARDMSNDLALLSVEGVAFDSHFVLGDASDVRVGQSVYALGFPLPNLLGSDIRALTGIISSLSGFRGNSAQFQIEMSINLGNSGGPLFNSRGQVVGVLSSKLGIGAVQATGSIPEGVGFATKSDMVRSLLAAAGRLEAGSSEPDTKSLEALVEQFKSAVVRVEARTNGE